MVLPSLAGTGTSQWPVRSHGLSTGGLKLGRVKRAAVGVTSSAAPHPPSHGHKTPAHPSVTQNMAVCPVHSHAPPADPQNIPAPQCFPRDAPLPRAPIAFLSIPSQPTTPQCTPGYPRTQPLPQDLRCFLCPPHKLTYPIFPWSHLPQGPHRFLLPPSAPKCAPHPTFLPSSLCPSGWMMFCSRNARFHVFQSLNL